tara:strand:+ start:1978 stop:2910 length:933 start_codon:yes stop_codon:yes gene_type:complete
MAFKMKNPSMAKLTKAAGNNRVAMKMKMESAAKMKKDAATKMKKSPLEKELVGKQHNLPEELKAKIEAAPSKMKSATKMKPEGATGKLVRQKKRDERKMARKLKKGLKARGREMEGKQRGTGMIFNEKVKEDLKKFSKVDAPTKLKKDSPAKKTYREAWEAMKSYDTKEGNREEKKTKYGTVYSDDEKGYRKFVNDAKAHNQKKYGTTEPTKAAEKFTGGDKKELEKLAKPKKIARREGGEKGNKLAKVTTPRKPSIADQITTAKKEGGRGARKIAAAERKMRKAAGDTSKRGDRKRRKAAKKMQKAGIA